MESIFDLAHTNMLLGILILLLCGFSAGICVGGGETRRFPWIILGVAGLFVGLGLIVLAQQDFYHRGMIDGTVNAVKTLYKYPVTGLSI